jgi:hypothetical protein
MKSRICGPLQKKKAIPVPPGYYHVATRTGTAVVGAGVLAFSASSRTREFGIRMALGSQPRHLLMNVVGLPLAGGTENKDAAKWFRAISALHARM